MVITKQSTILIGVLVGGENIAVKYNVKNHQLSNVVVVPAYNKQNNFIIKSKIFQLECTLLLHIEKD